jgi:predicted helicase
MSKLDIFYYIYGLFHSKEYVNLFSAELKKAPPRIPISENFVEIVRIGKELMELHIGYESIEPYTLDASLQRDFLNSKNKIQKLKFFKKDSTKIVINENLIIKNIPAEVHDYQVNGKSALAWVVDKYNFKVNSDAQISNDPNSFSNDDNYIFELIFRIINLSIQTNKLIKELPKLKVIN